MLWKSPKSRSMIKHIKPHIPRSSQLAIFYGWDEIVRFLEIYSEAPIKYGQMYLYLSHINRTIFTASHLFHIPFYSNEIVQFHPMLFPCLPCLRTEMLVICTFIELDNWRVGKFTGNPDEFDGKNHGVRFRFSQQNQSIDTYGGWHRFPEMGVPPGAIQRPWGTWWRTTHYHRLGGARAPPWWFSWDFCGGIWVHKHNWG